MEQGNEQGLEMSAHLTKEELDAIERVGPGWCGDETFQRLCHMARVAQRRVEMSEKLTREQIEDWKSTAFLAAHVMINGEEAVCDFVRLCDLALAALAPAAEPTEEQVERAAKVIADCPTIDAPKLAWPAWCGTARSILGAARASPVQPLGVLHQSPDGRVFKSFPSTDAPQAPSEAVAWTLGDDVILARFWTADYPPEGWQPLYATPSAGTPEERG